MSAGPDASVMGNIMERGWGTTPYADHIECASGYEVLLPTGDLIQTGYGAFGDPKLAALDRWGIGPSLDGLFSQSNLGIVTKLSVWLLPRPEHVQAIFFQLETDAALSQAVDVLRPFKLNDTIGSGPRFTHLYHSLQYNIPYPWAEMPGKPFLSIERARQIGAQLGIAEWNGNLGLFGSEAEVTQRSERIRQALRGIASKMYVVDEKSFDFNKGICLDRPEDRSTADAFLMMTGHIPPAPVRHHWRKRRNIPSKNSPEEDQCGYMFITAVTPFEGREVVQACTMITESILEYGFEPSAVAYAIRNRNVSIHAGIAFDREVAEEDEAALVCHETLAEKLYRAGYLPHRLGIQSMGVLQEAQPSYKRLLRQIKDAIDPHHILAPGRYEF
jgi:4-cresol dehydrogenase (hydroxylating)